VLTDNIAIMGNALAKKNIYVCVAVFTKEDNGTYTVTFPELDGYLTFGITIEEAYERAIEAFSGWLMIAKSKNIPIPKFNLNLLNSKVEDENEIRTLVYVDLDAFIRRVKSKSVKKTVTIPSWLNEIAEEKQINYSKVFQNALKHVLEVN
jgi:predicted RNase H-like HicB family nuclease